MIVQLFQGDIGLVGAEGLVCPVDGVICTLGGSAAATALKHSFDPEERDELFSYLEQDVKGLRPILHGESRIIPGEGRWDWLVIVAALPHHANDVIISEEHFASVLEKAVANGIRMSCRQEIGSLAMTVMGSSYRVPAQIAIQRAVNAISDCRHEDIRVNWCFLDKILLASAQKLLVKAGIPVDC
ncbi:MAG: hypothetical protein K0A94_12845 [Desulfuromonadales bacterium]|nr:hypothetical protein [Desulfuromonadales bacterium]